jgi:hypothetical protein
MTTFGFLPMPALGVSQEGQKFSVKDLDTPRARGQ